MSTATTPTLERSMRACRQANWIGGARTSACWGARRTGGGQHPVVVAQGHAHLVGGRVDPGDQHGSSSPAPGASASWIHGATVAATALVRACHRDPTGTSSMIRSSSTSSQNEKLICR